MTTQAGKPEHDLMKAKKQSYEEKLKKQVSCSYNCPLLNQQQHDSYLKQIFDKMQSIDPNQKDLTQHDEIILGKIQGQLSSTNFKQLIEGIVGEVSQEKVKNYLKQKTQQKHYGQSNKDKNCCIRQIKKIQLLKKFYDVNQIQKKRKHNNLYRTYIKGVIKFLELLAKIVDDNDSENIANAFEQYNNMSRDQKKYNSFLKQLDANSFNAIEKPSSTLLAVKIEPTMIQSSEVMDQNIIQQQGSLILEQSKIQNKIQQKVNEQKQKNQQQAATKTPKKNQKPRKRQPKNKQEPAEKQATASPTTQNNSGAEIGQKSQNKVNQQNEQKLKKIQKQKQQQKIKTEKKKNNLLITNFFNIKKKQPQTQSQNTLKLILPESTSVKNQQDGKTPSQNAQNATHPLSNNQLQKLPLQTPESPKSIWDTFYKQQTQQSSQLRPPIQYLRSQLRGYKMQNQQLPNQPYYLNMVITLSTIEYYDYYMKLTRQVNFAHPFLRMRDVFYFEDQSEEFEGQSASADEEIQEEQGQEDKLSQGNNTILDDDHLSFEEISSCDSHEMDIKVEYGKGNKWFYNFRNCGANETSERTEKEQMNFDIGVQFQMICLCEKEQKMPLRLEEEQQQRNTLVMTPQIWRDIYKIAHGYSGTKDNIIKQLSQILPTVSKSWIDAMLRERSQKVGNQRYIKKYFIDDIKQKIPQIDQILTKVIQQRNLQLKKIRDQKNFQKDQKLQKDILQCQGSLYIVNLLKQLKQKGYKQLRRVQLIQFINQRKGQEWDKIKAEMNTMSRPTRDDINNVQMVNGERIDEEVQVDDQEFNRVQKKNQQGESRDMNAINNNTQQQKRQQNQLDRPSFSSSDVNNNNGAVKKSLSTKNTLDLFFKTSKKKQAFADYDPEKMNQRRNQITQGQNCNDKKSPLQKYIKQKKAITTTQKQIKQEKAKQSTKQKSDKKKTILKKKRKNQDKDYIGGIYMKNRSINRARNTRNSQKTGIISFQQQKRLRKLQREARQKQGILQQQQCQQQQNQQNNSYQQSQNNQIQDLQNPILDDNQQKQQIVLINVQNQIQHQIQIITPGSPIMKQKKYQNEDKNFRDSTQSKMLQSDLKATSGSESQKKQVSNFNSEGRIDTGVVISDKIQE